MSQLNKLREAKYAAEAEMAKCRRELSEAQSRFAKANKKYKQAMDAYIVEAEKQ